MACTYDNCLLHVLVKFISVSQTHQFNTAPAQENTYHSVGLMVTALHTYRHLGCGEEIQKCLVSQLS